MTSACSEIYNDHTGFTLGEYEVWLLILVSKAIVHFFT